MNTNVIKTIFLLVLTLSVFLSQNYLSINSLTRETKNEFYHELPSSLLSIVALNQKTFASDLLWIDALLYFAESRHIKRVDKPKYILDYAYTIQELDPLFTSITSWLMSTFTTTRGQLTHEEIMEIMDFMDTTLALYPTNSQLFYDTGIMAIGFSEGHTKDDRIKEFERGIYYLKRCLHLSGCPSNTFFLITWMGHRIAALAGSAQVSDKQELEIYLAAYTELTDPELRARMRKQLVAMGVGEAQLDALEREQVGQVRLDYEARAPYLPLDLWALTVSPRP